MKSKFERHSVLVALTLLGAAAIVPALLAGRLASSRAFHARVDRLKANLAVSQPPGSDASGSVDPDSQAHDLPLRDRFDAAGAALDSGTQVPSVRFFSKYEIEQAKAFATERAASATGSQADGAANGNRDGVGAASRDAAGSGHVAPSLPQSTPSDPNLLPPLSSGARVEADAVVVEWNVHPSNPQNQVLRTEVWRWMGDSTPRMIFAGTKASESYRDTEPCSGIQAGYALRTIQLDQVEGVEVRHSAWSAPSFVVIPQRFDVTPLRFADASKQRVVIRVTDRRDAGDPNAEPRNADVTAGVQEELAPATIGKTGWKVIAIEEDVRQEFVDVQIPLFEADGSRSVVNGAPVFAPRTIERSTPYPVIRMRDACGTERTLRAPLSGTSNRPAAPAPAAPNRR